MICQCDEANRTNNHAEAFHRGIASAVHVAHPQTLVLIQLLVNIEREAMLRFDAQRSGKDVQTRDRRLDDLETSIEKTMKSDAEGLFRNDAEYLSAIAKLYVEYNHLIKTARFRNNTALVRRVGDVKDAVLKALDDQNHIVFGEDASSHHVGEVERVFVDADFNSEIVFDTTPMLCDEQQNVINHVECQFDHESDVPMEICSEEVVSGKLRQETKQRVCDEKSGVRSRKRRRTLIQWMRGKR